MSIMARLEGEKKKKKKNIYKKLFLKKLVNSHVFLGFVRSEDFLHFLFCQKAVCPGKMSVCLYLIASLAFSADQKVVLFHE